MSGGDSMSSAIEENEEEHPFYDPLDNGLFSEEELRNVMADTNPNLMDLDFNQNPLPPIPSPPLAPSMEINEYELSQELSLSISNCDDNNNEFLGPPFDPDDLLLSWDMFDIPSDDPNDNIDDNVLGEIGADNVLGEIADDSFLGEIGNDDVLGEICNDNVVGEIGNNVGEDNGRLEVSTRVFRENGVNFETGGPSSATPAPVQVITPPMSEGILLCTCCNILRSLVHANGNEMTRLEIYGGIGFFCHAILETRLFVDSLEPQHQTFHLMGLTMEDVRSFIENYCLARQEDGFTVMQDSNAEFYQALNACCTSNQSLMAPLPSRDDVPMSLSMPDEALNVPPVPQYVGLRKEPPGSLKERERRKTPLAVQRERTGKMTLKDVGHYFHLPIEEAARRLSLCPTVMKKICRKGGLPRWPHRKIKSMLKKISALKTVLSKTTNEKIRKHAEEEIERLEKEISEICSAALRRYK